jgi:hypothetical protein
VVTPTATNSTNTNIVTDGSVSPASAGKVSNGTSKQPADISALAGPQAKPAEPNPDMEVRQGTERNVKGDKPQAWCKERGVGAFGASVSGPAAKNVGMDQSWFKLKLPPATVLVSV